MIENKERKRTHRRRFGDIMGMKETFIIYLYRERAKPHRCYVGQKLARTNGQRDYAHRKAKSSASKFNNWVRKHIIRAGVPFDDVLEYFELETYHGENVSEREHRYIDLWNSIENGWNLEKNGAGGSPSEEHRRKIGLANSKVLTGKKHSEEHKRNRSDSMKGRTKETHEGNRRQSEKMKGGNNPNYGKERSKEVKLKISKTKQGTIPWNKGKKRPKISKPKKVLKRKPLSEEQKEEQKRRRSEAHKGKKMVWKHPELHTARLADAISRRRWKNYPERCFSNFELSGFLELTA